MVLRSNKADGVPAKCFVCGRPYKVPARIEDATASALGAGWEKARKRSHRQRPQEQLETHTGKADLAATTNKIAVFEAQLACEAEAADTAMVKAQRSHSGKSFATPIKGAMRDNGGMLRCSGSGCPG